MRDYVNQSIIKPRDKRNQKSQTKAKNIRKERATVSEFESITVETTVIWVFLLVYYEISFIFMFTDSSNLKLKLCSIEDEKCEKRKKKVCLFCLFFLFFHYHSIEHNFIFKFEKWINNIKIKDIMYLYVWTNLFLFFKLLGRAQIVCSQNIHILYNFYFLKTIMLFLQVVPHSDLLIFKNGLW